MTKRYSILQKKLQEVETQLKKVLLLPPETPYHESYAEDIEKRLEFLKTFFSAEVDSSPKNPHHLHHIGKRLALLETVFRDWNEFKTTSPVDNYPLDTVSNCSCTESCLNEDGVEIIENCKVEEEKKEEEEVRVCGGGGRGGGRRVAVALAMGGGVLIGMGLSVVSFVVFSLSHSSPNAMCLVPT